MIYKAKYLYTLPYKFNGLRPSKQTRAQSVLKDMNLSSELEKGFLYAYDQLIQSIADNDQDYLKNILQSDLSQQFIEGLQELKDENKTIVLKEEQIKYKFSIHEFCIYSKSQQTNEKEVILKVVEDETESHIFKVLFSRGFLNLNFSIKCFIKSPFYLDLDQDNYTNSHHLIGFTNQISFDQMAKQMTTIHALVSNSINQNNWVVYSFDNLKD
ncbi:hypothetical protein pb186bvf_010247 [Paramecium bursaria]